MRGKLRSIYYKQIRVILSDFEFRLSRNALAKSLGVPNLDDLFFRRQSLFLFAVLTTTLPSELFAYLIANSLFHERSGNLSFFRESLSRFYKSNVVCLANTVVQRWVFDWFNLSKEEFKKKIQNL